MKSKYFIAIKTLFLVQSHHQRCKALVITAMLLLILDGAALHVPRHGDDFLRGVLHRGNDFLHGVLRHVGQLLQVEEPTPSGAIRFAASS